MLRACLSISFFAAVLGLALMLPNSAWAVRVERMYGVLANNKPMEVAAGEAIVRFNPSVANSEKSTALQAIGARLVQELPMGWSRIELPPGVSVSRGLISLSQLAGILQAEPNHVYRALKSANDPLISGQYHLNIVDAFSAWDFEVGNSSPVIVAVIDSGIEVTHPDLAPKLIPGLSAFCDPVTGAKCVNSSTTTVACEHGTEVSGVAAAETNNGVDVAGMSWGARLVSLKVFRDSDCNMQCCSASGDCSPASTCGTTDVAIMNAINYATTTLTSAGYGRVVINMSLGAGSPCAQATQDAIRDAVSNHNVVFVAAAGNDGSDVNSPGNCAGVIPVGATDASDSITYFSSRDISQAVLATNGVVAPGFNVVTTAVNGGTTGSASGTSFSSPLVAGLAALILSAKPSLTPAQVQSTIRGSAQTLGQPSSVQGAGRINAFLALRLTERGTISDLQKAYAFPDPFHPASNGNLTIFIPPNLAGSSVDVKIYTIDGRMVRDLGAQTSWDGRNAGGNPVASGVYMFLVKTSQGRTTGKFAVVR